MSQVISTDPNKTGSRGAHLPVGAAAALAIAAIATAHGPSHDQHSPAPIETLAAEPSPTSDEQAKYRAQTDAQLESIRANRVSERVTLVSTPKSTESEWDEVKISPESVVGFPQFPSLSPDGDLVAFHWAGDIWVAPSEGGASTRVTSHPAADGRSLFTPDGRTLLFESNRDGPTNIYSIDLAITSQGIVAGPAQRVTRSDRTHTLAGVSPDGEHVLISGFLTPTIYRSAKMFKAPINGGPVEPITDAFGRFPRMSHDGDAVFFTRGRWDWTRPAYRGSGDMDLFRLDLGSGDFTQLTGFDGSDGDGWPLPDGSVVFVSSRDGQNNLYHLEAGMTDLDGDPRQLTSFKPTRANATIGHGVRDLSVSADGSTAVFCVWDTMYTLDLTRRGARPSPVRLLASADGDASDTRLMTLDREVTEAALSPDGQTMAVVARGEVFLRNVKDGRPTMRVTETHAREQNLTWSPDNRFLYFASDKAGVESIYRASVKLSRTDIEPEEEADEDAADEAEGDASDAPASAAPLADGVSGVWACTVTGGEPIPGGRMDVTFTLRMRGDQVTGTMSSALGEADVSGSWDAATRTLTLSFFAAGADVTVTATIEDGLMTGAVAAGGQEYAVNGAWQGPAPGAEPAEAAEPPAEDEGEAEPRDSEAKDKKQEKKEKIDYGKRWAGALLFEVEPVVDTDATEIEPQLSPDGTKMLFIRGRGDLVMMDLVTGRERMLIESWSNPDTQWLGDSRHIVYEQRDLEFNADIFLLDTEEAGAEPINITRHPDNDVSPRISADGKFLVFLSERSGENWSWDVWGVYLDKSLEGLRDYELEERFKKSAGEYAKVKPLDPVWVFGDDPADKPEAKDDDEATEALTFDTDDAYLRVFRMTNAPGSESNLQITPGGDRVIFSGNINGQSGLHAVNHSGRDRKLLTSGSGGNLRISANGKKLSMVRGGQAATMNVSGGSPTTVAMSAPVRIDVAQEQKQKFAEAARRLGEGFYHPTLKGLDWDTLSERYGSLAMRTRTSGAFNRIGQMLFGELNGSHTGMRGGGAWSTRSPGAGYLGVDVEAVDNGYRVTGVLRGSPAAAEHSRLHVGDVIVGVNGEDIAPAGDGPAMDIVAAMEGAQGRETLLKLDRADADNGEYMIITPISYGALTGLMYENEVLDRRRAVEELSDGRLGYLHIRGMNEPSVRDFERDLYAAASGKDGLIIDVRDNGGGYTTDILLASLTAPRHAYTVPRGADHDSTPKDAYPRDRRLIYGYSRPIVVLMNENSFSNAEIFSHAIKTIGRGDLVGVPTFGGVISTGSIRLIDGTSVRMPFRGWYLPDGTDMENNGAEPHVYVEQTPGSEVEGQDDQLGAAVEHLLGKMNGVSGRMGGTR